MVENTSKNLIIIKYCLPLTAVSFIIFLFGFFFEDVVKTSLWAAAVFIILASLVIYCFTAEKITNDNIEEIENLKTETKILSNIHYKLHLINPTMKLKEKISFSLKLLTEYIPEATFVCYSCNDGGINFVAATRFNSRQVIEKVFQEDELISEVTNRIKSITDYNSLKLTGGLEKPIIISNGIKIQGQIFTIDFYSNVVGILVQIGKSTFSNLEQSIINEFRKSLGLVFDDHKSYEMVNKTKVEIIEKQINPDLENYSEKMYEVMFPNTLPTLAGWDIAKYYMPSSDRADFMDMLNINTDKQMILFGKCSGKGINAASYVNKLKVIIRCFIEEYQSPAKLLNKISTYLNSELMPDLFVDVTALTFSSLESKITLAMAGNTIPIINRTRSGFAEIPDLETGIPLGLFNQGTEPYKDQYINIMPGDGIVLHTDGITDFPGKGIERLSNEDLKNILDKLPEQKAELMLDSLVKQIKHSNSNELPEEDHSLIYLKAE